MHTLNFSDQINYPEDEQGINLDILLSIDNRNFVSVIVKPDTGSTFCIFQRKYAEALEIEVETGSKESIRSAKGNFTVFGHWVNLKFLTMEWSAMLYFAQDEDFPVNVVGRAGFLSFLKIGLVDYEHTLYFNSYNE